MSTIISKEPWWKTPPRPGQGDDELEWGYLITYSDGRVEFTENERPTPEEIAQRKGCRLNPSLVSDEQQDASCPHCDGLGYTYEGGLSLSPEIDNRIPCHNCNNKPD